MIPAKTSTDAILSMHPTSQCGLFKNIVAFSDAMSYKLGHILVVKIHSLAKHINFF